MHLIEHDYPPGVSTRFDALVIGAGSDDFSSDPIAAVALAGGRLVASVRWGEAVARVGALGSRPVLLLDARDVADEVLAMVLASLDGLAAGRDLTLIIGIGQAQIDLVAAGLSLSQHDILCDPSRSDWLTALALSDIGERLTLNDRGHDRDNSESARLAKLNAEVARITNVLARLSKREELAALPAVSDRVLGFVLEPGEEPPAVTATAVRQIVRARRLRDRHLGAGLFEDPAWDMILDLYAAHLERAQVSVSSLCIAAAVAPTTALRWIARLTEAGIFERRPDPFDRRRAFMSLSDVGLTGMHRYVTSVRAQGLPLV